MHNIRIRFTKEFIFALCFTSPALYAEGISYWQCTIQDELRHQWHDANLYERVAMNKALEACKKESPVPMSCKMDKNNCSFYFNGQSTRPLWQCTALDHDAKPWQSSVHPSREEAALSAKEDCQSQSSLPETCYINLITCKNLNKSS